MSCKTSKSIWTDEICLALPISEMYFYIILVYSGSHNYSHAALYEKSDSLKINRYIKKIKDG